MVIRIASALDPAYDGLMKKALRMDALYCDETDWKVNGALHWMIALESRDVIVYVLSKSRKIADIRRILRAFCGIIILDSLPSWNHVGEMNQKCHLHYLRGLRRVLDHFHPSPMFVRFARTLERIIWDLHREDADKVRLLERIERPISARYPDEDCRRTVKLLKRERDILFTFIGTSIDWHTNLAEHIIHKIVFRRKVSEVGAAGRRTQERHWPC